MEQRFRERSERHGGGPAATGEIDGRVADEMREFFDASQQQLKTVVPHLQNPEESRAMAETTDEIRKKINDFFAQVKDAGATAKKSATGSQRLAKRKARWTGALPARDGGSASASQKLFVPATASARRESIAPRAAAPAQSFAPPPAPAPAPAATPEPEKMDLKAALEKLRRHGVVKNDDKSAQAMAEARADQTHARVQPPPRPVTPVPAARREPQPSAAPRVAPNAPAARVQPRPAPAPAQSAAPAPAPAPAAPPAPVVERRPQRAAPAPAPAPAPAAATPPRSDPGDGFDSIFKEVEGIVLDTLKSSTDEKPAGGRPAPVAEKPRPREAAPVSEQVSQLVCLRTDSEEVPVATPQPTPAPSSARGPQFARPEEDAEEEPEEQPAAPYDWGVKPAARPKGAWLLETPDTSVEEAPAAPSKPGARAPQAKAAAEPDASAGMMGARNYLVRKANEEVRRFAPVVKKLKDDAVLDAKDVDGDSSAGGDDGFLSADSFKDDVPRGADVETELSPMRLVEEIRRIKRVTQALIAKGLISAVDLERTGGDD